ncbi:MAG: hypothetical protein K2W96_00375 [Gemmataceae bacterium]|nr:hypothetical protein [Gemmataceae bacterium]
MPLLDHFRPPLSVERPWDGVHSVWASAIARLLNHGVLPEDYVALPQVTMAGRIEIDVATVRDSGSGGGVATATYAPPRPALSGPLDASSLAGREVQVVQNLGGPRLRAAIELVSPGNKDRPAARLAFAVKCAAYLSRGVSVVVVDVVTERSANLHAELVALLRLPPAFAWASATGLSAIAYHPAREGTGLRLDLWPHELAIGEELPELPLWLEPALSVPLELEESYREACADVRIRF